MMLRHFILLAAWLMFSFFHSFFANTGIKLKIQGLMGTKSRYYQLMYSVFACLSLFAILTYQASIDSIRLWSSGGRFIAGLPVAFLGFLLMAACARKYFLPVTGLQSALSQNQSPVLETRGSHRLVRHPLYLGTLLLIFGLWCCFPTLSNLLAIMMITLYTFIGIRLEEKKLVDRFGDAYREYQDTVPMIIPFI